MNHRTKSLVICLATLLGLLIFAELFLRSYGAEFRISISNLSRKKYVQARTAEFMAAARATGVSKDTFNIYFLGESTMWGVPFSPELSVPNTVNYRLGATLGGRPVRSINFSSAAKDAVYTRYIAELLLREKKIFRPSLIVIYSGHNQFLKFHPTDPDLHLPGIGWLAGHSEIARQMFILISRSTGQILEIDQRKFFDRGPFPFDPHGYDKVLANYKKQILEIVESAQKNNVPIVISNLVCNYVDWEPNRSVFCDSAGKEQKQRFANVFREGLAFERQENYEAALEAYHEALSICDRFAEAYFRQGKIYTAQHEYEKAWGAFQKANDYDAFPTYAVSSQNEFIQSLARFDHVHVVDSLTYFRKNSKDSLLDEDLIIDSVHPNLGGYLLLSQAIAEKIFSLFSSPGENLEPLGIETAKRIFLLGDSKMFEVYYQTGRWVTRLATWHYDPENRFGIAERFFRKAIEINPARSEGYLGLAIIAFLRKDNVKAKGFLHKARSLDLDSTEEYFKNPWIRKIVRRAESHGLKHLSGALKAE